MLGQTSRVNSSHKRSSYTHMSENEWFLNLIEILYSTRCTVPQLHHILLNN